MIALPFWLASLFQQSACVGWNACAEWFPVVTVLPSVSTRSGTCADRYSEEGRSGRRSPLLALRSCQLLQQLEPACPFLRFTQSLRRSKGQCVNGFNIAYTGSDRGGCRADVETRNLGDLTLTASLLVLLFPPLRGRRHLWIRTASGSSLRLVSFCVYLQ